MKLSSKTKHIFLKCAEELNELSLELLQAVNKPNKNNWKSILNELNDVAKWLEEIKNIKK
jgi:NTP pyrophosphatase (non-canonical NTP hydrolase)